MKRLASMTLILSCLSLSACGNAVFTDVEGQTGISMTNGSINIHVAPCSTGVDYVDISGVNINGVNQSYANFIADEPESQPFSIDVNAPQEPWRAVSEVTLPTGEDDLILVLAGSLTEDEQTAQTNATIGEINTLKEGEILTTQGEVNVRMNLEEFNSCTAE